MSKTTALEEENARLRVQLMVQAKIPLAVELLVRRLESRLTPAPPLYSEWYGWHALSIGAFISRLAEVREELGPGHHRFLDVGSGIGTKLYLADHFGFSATGIEINPTYADLSRQLWPEYGVYTIDATRFTGYGKFDVVYSYRPAKHNFVQDTLNQTIQKQMKDGAIFMYFDRDPIEKSL